LPVPETFRISGYSPFDSNEDEEEKYPVTTSVNPATGAVMYYQLPENVDSIKMVTLEVRDDKGNLVRSFSNKAPKVASDNSLRNEPVLTVNKGLNRFVWNLRRKDMPTIDNVYIEGSYRAGRVNPGIYNVTLTVDGAAQSTQLVVQGDPRMPSTAADYQAQDDLLKKLEQDVTDIHVAVTRMRGVSKQVNEVVALIEHDASKASLVKLGKELNNKLKAWEEKAIQPRSQSYDDVINFVNKLSANIIFVHGEVNGTVPYVTEGQKARYAELHSEWVTLKNEMDQLLSKDVAGFNAQCRALAVDNVLMPQ
jgi:hypothetical protein